MNRQTATGIPLPAPSNQLLAAIEIDGVVRIAMTYSPNKPSDQRWRSTLTTNTDTGQPQDKKPVGKQATPFAAIVKARHLIVKPEASTS